MSDLVSLPKGLIDSINVVGGETLAEKIRLNLEGISSGIIPKDIPQSKGRIRKLVYFPDREDKVRVVAILDYWSQTALKPLHTYLFKVLRRIPQDRTFSQGAFIGTFKDCKEI